MNRCWKSKANNMEQRKERILFDRIRDDTRHEIEKRSGVFGDNRERLQIHIGSGTRAQSGAVTSVARAPERASG